jgi:hypothetical protein
MKIRLPARDAGPEPARTFPGRHPTIGALQPGVTRCLRLLRGGASADTGDTKMACFPVSRRSV